MNDNLRYISLQYIKGTNYEEITCFDFERITKLLDIQGDLSEYPKQSVESLKDVKEEERCKIGESFLNDLVNYYNFKDVKKKLGRSLVKVKSYMEYDFDEKYNYGDYNKASVKLVKLIKNREMALKSRERMAIKDGTSTVSTASTDTPTESNDTSAKNENKDLKELINGVKESLDVLKDGISVLDASKKAPSAKELEEKIGKILATIGAGDTGATNETLFNRAVISELKTLNSLILNEGAKNKLHYMAEKKALDDLIIILNSYIKLCTYNISKYDNIFQQNDISNIDDAFMIESYSKFLKKLDRLKRRLESKDEGRLLRDLTHTLDRLFNLYGVNDPEKLLNGDTNKDALNYIASHILNYR